MIPDAARYGQRGGRAFAHKHVVDNKLYTTAQVAKRLGVCISTARNRLKARRGPHTWESLK